MAEPMPHEQKGIGTVVVAALVGGLAGVLVGLMVAPKSGRALRTQLGKKAWTVIKEVDGLTGEKAVEAIQTVRQDVVREGRRLVRDVKTLVQELRQPEKEEAGREKTVSPANPSA